MDLTLMETSALQELQSRLCDLSVTVTDFCRKIEPTAQER